MPRRWPRPQGTSVSSARTPSVERAARSAGAPSGVGGRRQRRRAARRRRARGPPSIGRPSPSSTRPSSCSPTAHAERLAGRRRPGCPGRSRACSPSGISSVRPSRKPTTSAVTGGWLRPRRDRAELADLGAQPGGLDHEADQVRDAAAAARRSAACTRLGVAARASRASCGARPRTRRARSSPARCELLGDAARRSRPRRCARCSRRAPTRRSARDVEPTRGASPAAIPRCDARQRRGRPG